MAPGLAFKGKDGLPIVLSAKCTHLGCTVGSEVDAQGRVLCPCHVSYFDVHHRRTECRRARQAAAAQIGWALVDARRQGRGRAGSPAQPSRAVPTRRCWRSAALYITKPGGLPAA